MKGCFSVWTERASYAEASGRMVQTIGPLGKGPTLESGTQVEKEYGRLEWPKEG
jgi:hypothetical protein